MSNKHRSFWLEDVANDAPDQAPLAGEPRTDVAIIGGGYVGLWTAIHLKRLDPSCRVAIVEQDICGGGASGRNGGFALSWWPKLSSLISLCGVDDAIRIGRDSQAALTEISDFCTSNGIDAHFKQTGWLWTATSNAQANAWDGVVRACERHGLDAFKRLDPAEVTRRSGSTAHRSGVIELSGSTLHPARLVRGMRRVALALGVEIFEQTRMESFSRARPVVIKTAGGTLTADKMIIASNAWAAGIRELSRMIVPITSDMIVTAPLPEELAKIGWTGGECITDSQTMVDYYHVTKDGRIAFGKGGWGIAFGGRLGLDFDRNAKRAAMVESDLRRYYPMLKSLRVTHDWCGPIDRTPNSLPLLGKLFGADHILFGVGWSGNGVGPSVIGGKILASLALGKDDQWSRYPLIGRSVGTFPPEPIRYVGAHVVRAAVAAKEKAEIDDKRPSFVACQLAKLAPAGLEDKE